MSATEIRTELPAGGRVQVWNRYLEGWAGDFRIEAPTADGAYRIRRACDDQVLPTAFAPEDLLPMP